MAQSACSQSEFTQGPQLNEALCLKRFSHTKTLDTPRFRRTRILCLFELHGFRFPSEGKGGENMFAVTVEYGDQYVGESLISMVWALLLLCVSQPQPYLCKFL